MNERGSIVLIYDGECPVCTRYSAMLSLRALDPDVELVDARSNHPLVEKVVKAGIDLDEGMVLMIDGSIHHGADAMHHLALISTRSGWFNRVNYFLFRSRFASRLAYPLLRAGRNALLRVLGRPRIGMAR